LPGFLEPEANSGQMFFLQSGFVLLNERVKHLDHHGGVPNARQDASDISQPFIFFAILRTEFAFYQTQQAARLF